MIIAELMYQAEQIALLSPCTRRKYGVVISEGSVVWVTAFNERVGRCCGGNICVRDTNKAPQNRGIEVGAELHAETIALLRWGSRINRSNNFYLACIQNGKLIPNPVPCHYCAMMMSYVGYDNYIVRNEHGELVFKSTWETIEEHESTYRGTLV